MKTPRSISQIYTLAEALAFSADKVIARDMTYKEVHDITQRCQASWGFGESSGVQFTDGSCLVLAMECGFPGTDVTGSSPDTVVWLAVAAKPHGANVAQGSDT